MKKSAAKQNEVVLENESKKQQGFQRQLKLVAGKLSELSELSGEKLSLVTGNEKILWTSEKPKAQRKPVAKKKGPPGAGRPEKTETKTTVDELQAMREAKARRARAQLQSKKKPAQTKKPSAEAKSQPKPFTVNRPAAAAKKKKRA